MKLLKGKPLIRNGSFIDNFLEKRYSSSVFSYRQIFAMLGPLILDQFFIYFIGMLTNAMISASSQESVTAVGLVSPMMMLVSGIFLAIASGGTIIVAQYKGKGDEEMIHKSAAQVIIITFLVASLLAVLLIVFANPLVNTIFGDAEQIVKDKASNYVKGYGISMFFYGLYSGVFAVLRGIGDTKTCLRLTVILNGLHLIGSMLFINVFMLDIVGTALSFNIARLVGGIIAMYLITSPKSQVSLMLSDFFSWDSKLQKMIIKMGIPFAAEQVFLNLGSLATQMYIIKLGTVATAANTIAASTSNMFYGIGFAVATLAITVIGQCIGTGDIELAKRYGKRMIELGTIIMVACVVIIYPLMPLILKLYAPSAEALPIIKQLILIGAIPIPFFWAMSYIMPSTLRAAGDANFTSLVCLICMWIFRVFLGYLLAITLKMGVTGVWISMGAEWAARSVFFAVRFKGKKWYAKRLV